MQRNISSINNFRHISAKFSSLAILVSRSLVFAKTSWLCTGDTDIFDACDRKQPNHERFLQRYLADWINVWWEIEIIRIKRKLIDEWGSKIFLNKSSSRYMPAMEKCVYLRYYRICKMVKMWLIGNCILWHVISLTCKKNVYIEIKPSHISQSEHKLGKTDKIVEDWWLVKYIWTLSRPVQRNYV